MVESRARDGRRIRVIDHRAERRLVVGGDILSVYPLDGDWSRVRSEYWWRALTAVDLPRRPTALLVGLGGGTQIHLLQQLRHPRLITVVERDPTVLRLAHDWFGLRRLGRIEYLCADAGAAVALLARARRRFDFVMEDAAYDDDPARAFALAHSLVPLVAPGGALVVNRHWRRDARPLATALAPRFREVRLRRVRRDAENVLICCREPLAPRGRRPASTRAQSRRSRL